MEKDISVPWGTLLEEAEDMQSEWADDNMHLWDNLRALSLPMGDLEKCFFDSSAEAENDLMHRMFETALEWLESRDYRVVKKEAARVPCRD